MEKIEEMMTPEEKKEAIHQAGLVFVETLRKYGCEKYLIWAMDPNLPNDHQWNGCKYMFEILGILEQIKVATLGKMTHHLHFEKMKSPEFMESLKEEIQEQLSK